MSARSSTRRIVVSPGRTIPCSKKSHPLLKSLWIFFCRNFPPPESQKLIRYRTHGVLDAGCRSIKQPNSCFTSLCSDGKVLGVRRGNFGSREQKSDADKNDGYSTGRALGAVQAGCRNTETRIPDTRQHSLQRSYLNDEMHGVRDSSCCRHHGK